MGRLHCSGTKAFDSSILLAVLASSLLAVTGAQAQMSVHFEDTVKEPSKRYFMHWDGFETSWFGRGLTLVKNGNMGGVPASGNSFSAASIRDTFGFEVTAVEDWDMAAANTEIANNNFLAYLASRTASLIDIHGGVPMGLGVDNNNNDNYSVNGNRRDKIDDIGEALVITFDLEGQLDPASAPGSFAPDGADSSFTNHGMGEFSKLILEGVWMKKYETASVPHNGRVDVIFYDASANQVVQQEIFVNCNSQTVGSNVLQEQEVEHGDILILAHPTLSTDSSGNPVDLTYIASELWGLSFDVKFHPPAEDPIVIPPNPSQHAFDAETPGLPGFSNIPREDGELVAIFRTDGDFANFDLLRTVAMDFHRGYLVTQTRGTTNGHAWGVFDISEITSGDPALPPPHERAPTQVGPWLRVGGSQPMHTYYGFETDLRVNNPGSEYYDLSNLPSLTKTFPAGYQSVGSGTRSAYNLPYNYRSGDGSPQASIWDARTGQQLSNFSEHGFGSISVPVGNLLFLTRIRAGERAVAVYDVSDPERPALLDVMRANDPRWRTPNKNGAYEPAIFENYLILSNSLMGGYTVFIDFSDPTDLKVHHRLFGTNGADRYMQFQDDRMFLGREVIDLSYIDQGFSTVEHTFTDHIVDGVNYGSHMGEYMLPLGNLVVCAENSDQGSSNVAAIWAFQAEPDVLGPKVGYHIPAAGATDQAVTSRIGLMIHETLDTTTLTDQNLKVFKVGDPEVSIPGTRTFSDKDIVTFTPDQPLDYNTTYRVVAEGIKDISGNPMERYEFDFTTQQSASSLWYPTINSVGISYVPSIIVGEPITFFTSATPDAGDSASNLEYRWDFGDGTVTDWTSHFEATHTYQVPGKFTVKAQVRSTSAPHLVTMRQLQPSAFYKPAGEDGFEPRIEAEDGTLTGPNGSIQSAEDSSGGKYVRCHVNSGVYWDFDSVGGAFDFDFAVALPEGHNPHPNPVYAWRARVFLSEIVNGSKVNERQIGLIVTYSTTYEIQSFSGYLPREGRYRLELKDDSRPREPRVDYVDIKISNAPIRYEADLLASGSITNGSITMAQAGTAWDDATGGYYVEGSEGFEINWDFEAFQEGTYDLTLRASSQALGSSQMGLFVNGEFVEVVTLSTGNFETTQISVELLEGANTIELRDSEGSSEFNVDYLEITVPAWTAPIAPKRSSQIVLDEVNRRIYTVNPDNDTITAIDADASPAVKLWETTVGDNPRGLGVDAQGRIWVTCFGSDTVEIVDSSGSSVFIQDFPYGAAPHDIVFNDAGTRAYVSLYGYDTIVQFDAELANPPVLSSVIVGPTPAALALNSGGTVLLASRFVSDSSKGDVYMVDIDTETGAMTLASTVALAADTTSENGPNSGRGIPNYLSDIVIHPVTGDAYVASQKVNTLGGNFLDGTTLNHDSTVRSIVSVVDSATNTERFNDRVDVDDSSQPSALWFSPGGGYLFVALQGNNVVTIIESGVSIGKLDVGFAPQGMTFDPVTNRLYVKNFMDRTVTVHNLGNSLVLGDFTNTFETTIDTVASESLPATILQGKQIFYNAADDRMSADDYLSCASCHQDGGHDGATWDFTQRGEGLRNTTDLRGRAGMAHGRVHWSGNFDEIQDFELDIVNQFGGEGFIADGDPNPSLGAPNAGRSPELDALAAYVSSLADDSLPKSPYKDEFGDLTAEALAGRALFDNLACASCHDPYNGYTDSGTTGALHDVGTLKAASGQRLGSALTGIDTPTLLSVSASAPYFHDGSVATLADVFDPTGDPERTGEIGQVHDLSGLNTTQLNQLVTYLLELDGDDIVPNLFPTITTLSLMDGTVGSAYSESLSASSGNAPLTWSVLSGALPAGLSLDPATGEIAGTPTAAGSASFTVQVSDLNGDTDSVPLTITIDSDSSSPVLGDMYAHTFDGSGASLNGTTVDVGNETWIADPSGAFDDGWFTSLSVASLPLQPVDGYIYTLTITATHSGSGWIGAGFAKTHSTAELVGDNDGLIWGLTRPLNNNQVAHLNPSGGTNNIATGSDSTNPSAITIVLDTSDGSGSWDVEWFVNGTSFHRVDDIDISFETAINAVKVNSGYGANTIDSFVLNVSTPSTLLYEHTFDGSASTLDGTAVDTATTGSHGIGNLWAADTDAHMDGSFASNEVASLPFTPEHGHVYALNVSGTYSGSGWIGLGFAGSNATNPLTSNGLLWGLTRPGAGGRPQVAHFNVSGGTNFVGDAQNATNPSTIAIVLDTRDGTGLWDVEWFVDGVSFHRIDNIDSAFETGINTIKLQSGFGANTYNWLELWVE